MFHVRQGRREFVPGVHRADARRRGAPEGPGRTGPETVLLPTDDPLPRGTHRRSLAVRLSDLALGRRSRGEGFLRLQSFESFRRVRGVAWFERGDRQVFPLTGNPTSLGCWRLRFKSGRTHTHPGVIRRLGRTARPPGLQPTLDRTVSARSVIILLGRPAVSNASGVGRLFGCSAYHLAAAGLGPVAPPRESSARRTVASSLGARARSRASGRPRSQERSGRRGRPGGRSSSASANGIGTTARTSLPGGAAHGRDSTRPLARRNPSWRPSISSGDKLERP